MNRLSDTYALDMAQRRADVAFYANAIRAHPLYRAGGVSMLIEEYGCGKWRLLRAVAELLDLSSVNLTWEAFDHDQRMFNDPPISVPVVRKKGLVDFNNIAHDRHTYALRAPDLSFIPYSTLCLLPHQLQAGFLKAIDRRLIGGAILLDVFKPKLRTGYHDFIGACRAPEDATDRQWSRRSIYEVDSGTRQTVVTRYYGPHPRPSEGRAEFIVREHVYWHTRESLHALCGSVFEQYQIFETPASDAFYVFRQS